MIFRAAMFGMHRALSPQAEQSCFRARYQKRQVAEESVAQGREYVESYVQFTHFAEGVQHLTETGASPQHRETVADH